MSVRASARAPAIHSGASGATRRALTPSTTTARSSGAARSTPSGAVTIPDRPTLASIVAAVIAAGTALIMRSVPSAARPMPAASRMAPHVLTRDESEASELMPSGPR